MPIAKKFLAAWCLWLIVPSLLAAAEPPATKDAGKVRLALMRAVPVKWDLDANFKTFLAAVDLAAEQKAELLITPECWLDGYASPAKDSTPERIREIAQDRDESPYLAKVAELAKQHGLSICFGFTSLEKGRAYNAAGLWDADGKLIGVYHKTHLQTHDLQYAAGRELPVWPTAWGKVGIMICADRRWPETARTLRLQGAKLILNPTYGFHNDLNEAMMRTRAYENQCFIAFAHPEQSLVTDPNGRVIAKANADAAEPIAPLVLVCDIDLSQAKDDNHLRDRRPEIYRVITEAK
jgi:beta-ureidopropionase